jgi:hypothetical protein
MMPSNGCNRNLRISSRFARISGSETRVSPMRMTFAPGS